ncbi:MAG TPA: hypothetical protein VGR26_16100 [Acidimicrobiales bacterium]|nr:hypothetical protein [Acidimicrobiales bacterium]
MRNTVAVRAGGGEAAGGESAMRRRRRCRPWVDVALAATLVALVACSDGRDAAAPTSTQPGEAAEADLGPLPSDRAAIRAWLDDNAERVRRFEAVAAELTAAERPEDCVALAERFNAELGPVSEHLEQVSASPDPVLAELLASATVSVRTIITACEAGDRAVADEERPGLANALVLIERRRVELEEGS